MNPGHLRDLRLRTIDNNVYSSRRSVGDCNSARLQRMAYVPQLAEADPPPPKDAAREDRQYSC